MTPWTVSRQAPLSKGLSRQGYWSGLLFPSPGDPPDPGIEPGSRALQADSLLSELREIWKNVNTLYLKKKIKMYLILLGTEGIREALTK